MEINLLVGGFPCQDYSVARSLSVECGIVGKKGVLFWEIVRLIRAVKPKYIILENVDRLLKSPSTQRGRDFSIILASLNNLGYTVGWRVINAADYGQTQRRRRLFLLAIEDSHWFYKKKQPFDAQAILKRDGFFVQAFPVMDDISYNPNSQTKLLPKTIIDIFNNFSVKYHNSGIMRHGVVFTEQLNPKKELPITLEEILQTNVEERYYLDENEIIKMKYLKGPKKINRTTVDGHSYTYSEGSVAFPEPLDKPSRTMLTSEGTVNRSSHVIMDPKTNKLRFLTPIECERLNGFPDDWTNGMSDRMRYFCMGNALVVGIIQRIWKRLLQILNEDNSNLGGYRWSLNGR